MAVRRSERNRVGIDRGEGVKRPIVKPPRVRLRLDEPTAPAGGLYFSSEKRNLQFIRSGCTVLDCVLGGGWPLGRIVNIVGDKSTGKTLLGVEAIANLFRQYEEADAWYNEIESAFDTDYARALGIPFERVNYETNCPTVETLFKHVEENVFHADRDPSRPGLYIVDSLDALSDAAEMGRDIDASSYGAAKAKKLSEFFRRSTQRLKMYNTCLMIISQVRDNIGVTFGEKHSRSGGKALDFYASQALWLAHLKTLRRTVEKVERPVGITVKARCKKNKVGLPYRDCEFDIKFGYGVDDIGASLSFLSSTGLRYNLPKSPDAEAREQLRKTVIERWYKIEQNFLTNERKYD